MVRDDTKQRDSMMICVSDTLLSWKAAVMPTASTAIAPIPTPSPSSSAATGAAGGEPPRGGDASASGLVQVGNRLLTPSAAYLHLFMPALSWQMHQLGAGA
ncbi:hypothetical protein EON66_12215 [archaeon]|nr:MAG: hypothetical protein EON66_12215 [archaeon]